MHRLLSLHYNFEGRVFKVSDYQRGYSWEQRQLEQFRNDLENLQTGYIPYMGVAGALCFRAR